MQETTYFSDNNVQVTSNQVVVMGKSYDLADVGRADTVWRPSPLTLVGLGLSGASLLWYVLLSLAILFDINSTAWSFGTSPTLVFVLVQMVGFTVGALGETTGRKRGYGIYVTLQSPSGRTDILRTIDRWYARNLVRAINNAIHQRNTQTIGTPAH